jgi:hypothetical protein
LFALLLTLPAQPAGKMKSTADDDISGCFDTLQKQINEPE